MKYNIKKRQIKSIFLYLIVFLLLFIIIYSNSYPKLALIGNNDRIAIIIMSFLILFSNYSIKKNNTKVRKAFYKLWGFNLFLFFYCFIILLFLGFGSGENILGSLVYYLLFMPVSFAFFSRTIKSTNQLMCFLFAITFIQSVIILFCILNDGFASTIDSVFNQNQFFDFQLMRNQGYPGGIWCITSTGAMQLSLGLISCSYFIMNGRDSLFFFLSFLFFSFVSIAVARTAIVLAVSCIVIVMISLWSDKGKEKLKQYAIVMIVLLSTIYTMNLPQIKDRLPQFFSRVFELRERGLYNGFFGGYFNGKTTVIPRISIDTVIGTGITSGISGQGVMINADGGFFRMYCAIGLPLCLVFYCLLIWVFCCFYANCNNKTSRLMIVLLGIIFFWGEFKEPFFYKKYYWLIVFLFAFLDQKNNQYTQDYSIPQIQTHIATFR